jgi:hypothetical protein
MAASKPFKFKGFAIAPNPTTSISRDNYCAHAGIGPHDGLLVHPTNNSQLTTRLAKNGWCACRASQRLRAKVKPKTVLQHQVIRRKKKAKREERREEREEGREKREKREERRKKREETRDNMEDRRKKRGAITKKGEKTTKRGKRRDNSTRKWEKEKREERK